MKNSTFVILVAIGVILLILVLSGSGNPQEETSGKRPLNTIPPTATPPPAVTPTIAAEPTPDSGTSLQSQVNTPLPFPTDAAANIDFVLDPGTPESCGATCRKTTATITNWGNATAHNVCIWLAVQNSNDEIIYLNGLSGVHTCIGDLGYGLPVSEEMVLEADCGALALKCVGQELILNLKITSDEKTVVYPEQHFG